MATLSIIRWKVSAYWNYKMVRGMKASGKIIKNKGKDNTSGRMVVSTKETIPKEKEMGSVKLFIKMVNNIKVNGRRVRNMEVESIDQELTNSSDNGVTGSLKEE